MYTCCACLVLPLQFSFRNPVLCFCSCALPSGHFMFDGAGINKQTHKTKQTHKIGEEQTHKTY